MGRSPCCSKEGLNKGAWNAIEDKILSDYIKVHGEGQWRNLPKKAGLKRCGKSCRLRWVNYLRPNIKRGNITPDEEDLIIRLHKLLGNRWSLIAGRLPGRTDNEIKNYWNTNLSKTAQGKQSNNTKNDKKTPTITPTVAPSPGIIRAKAVRCSKAIFTPQQQNLEYHITSNVDAAPSVDENLVQYNVAESHSGDGLASLTSKKEDISSEFMMDFNAGDICISEFLDLDFADLSDFDIQGMNDDTEGSGTNNECKSELKSFSGPALLAQEWSTDCLQADCMDPDFEISGFFY